MSKKVKWWMAIVMILIGLCSIGFSSILLQQGKSVPVMVAGIMPLIAGVAYLWLFHKKDVK